MKSNRERGGIVSEKKNYHRAKISKEERAYFRKKIFTEKVWGICRFLILSGLCFIILYPLIFMVSCAFREPEDMNDPTVMWIPRHFTLEVLKEAMQAIDFWETLKNTLLLNIGCSLVQVVSCSVTGYGFARFRFKGKGILFVVVIMTILVPQQIVLIPQYVRFRYFDIFGIFRLIMGEPLNLINHYATMYIPAITANGIRAGLMILIFRQFFKGLPAELEDAAYLDGCGPFRTFVQIIVPNAGSSFLIVFLASVVWYWNDYYVSTSFFNKNQTIALMLKNINTQLNVTLFADASSGVGVREKIVWLEASCLISILPLLILYICLQKNFVESVERSGLTG